MIRSSLKNKLEAFEAKEVLNGDSGYTDNRLLIVSGKTKSKGIDRMSAIERLHIAFQADGSFPSHYEDYDGSRKEGYPIRFSIKKIGSIIELFNCAKKPMLNLHQLNMIMDIILYGQECRMNLKKILNG